MVRHMHINVVTQDFDPARIAAMYGAGQLRFGSAPVCPWGETEPLGAVWCTSVKVLIQKW